MTPYELIRAKRDGDSLPPEALQRFLLAYARGDVPDYQMAALCMAVFFRGLDPGELRTWTLAMLRSGSSLRRTGPAPRVDKHSTGGVGDKVSLCLAPLVAACGVTVPMVSGRGLGHTGGTLDKLSAIPGLRTDLSLAEAERVLAELGVCLLGQSETLAPADRRLYALRDVTATVDSVPLIAASILSKKLAEDLDGLVLDVKVGSGAFMRAREDAERLARTLVELAADLGCPAVAWLTSMDAPLGRAVGNANELLEAVEVLRGGGPADVRALTLRLGAEMLVLGRRAASVAEAERRLAGALADGSGLERFRALIRAQGGDADVLEDPARLLGRLERTEVRAPAAGLLAAIDTLAVGLAAVLLGAGRTRSDDVVDTGVGLTVLRRPGEPVERDLPLFTVHHRPGQDVAEVCRRLSAAVRIADRPGPVPPLLLERLEAPRR
ncbi:MAG TPA: thymidine phosphorylase [Myxococcaceae bacterium]|nr:thymidine phosphorylase [Myxococcaceae bacterium]